MWRAISLWRPCHRTAYFPSLPDAPGFFHPRQRAELPESGRPAVSLRTRGNTRDTCVQSNEKCKDEENELMSSVLLFVFVCLCCWCIHRAVTHLPIHVQLERSCLINASMSLLANIEQQVNVTFSCKCEIYCEGWQQNILTGEICSSGLFVIDFQCFSDTTFLNCLPPSVCLTKTRKQWIHTAHLAVEGSLLLEDRHLEKRWCF